MSKVNSFIQGHFEQAVRSMIRAAYDEELARRRDARRPVGEAPAKGAGGAGRGRLDTGASPPP
jgi:hypothetical protein